jgi:uncharacterized DUF497 family protein
MIKKPLSISESTKSVSKKQKTVFDDPFAITIPDPDHSIEEERYVDIGLSSGGRILVVAYTERPPNIRLISCREATNAEQKCYEQSNF